MLTRPLALLVTAAALLAGLSAATANPAAAQDEPCTQKADVQGFGKTVGCRVTDESGTTNTTNTNSGGSGGSSGPAVCTSYGGTTIPCSVDGAWWSADRQ